jgi:hypothetical protein
MQKKYASQKEGSFSIAPANQPPQLALLFASPACFTDSSFLHRLGPEPVGGIN